MPQNLLNQPPFNSANHVNSIQVHRELPRRREAENIPDNVSTDIPQHPTSPKEQAAPIIAGFPKTVRFRDQLNESTPEQTAADDKADTGPQTSAGEGEGEVESGASGS